MTRLLPLIICCFLSFQLFSQQNSDDNIIRCYTTEHQEELRNQYPNMPSVEEFEEWLAPQIELYKKSLEDDPTKDNQTIIIPVVVHVLHNGGVENISDAQVEAQIEVLNEDFQRIEGSRGGATTSISNLDYSQITSPIDIEFRLAQTDPNGELTNGINRVDLEAEFNITGGANRTELEGEIKPGTIWDANFYMNMWTVSFKAPDQNLLGYAQFPFNSGLEGMESADNSADTDGVVQLYSAFGSRDKDDGSFTLRNTYDLGRTATHEVGHFFGLRHIWGDGLCLAGVGAGCACLADDFCEDTPNSGQPNSSCDGMELSTCPDRVGLDMVENYMDYSDDACMNIFTNDQKARVLTVLDVSPRRKELKTSLTYLPPGNFVQFAQAESQVIEGSSCSARTVTIDIKSLGNPTDNINVILGIKPEGGTATAGLWNDFELSDNSLVLAPGATETVSLTIYEDNNVESAEDFTIVIESVTGGDAELGLTNIEHRVLIQDDDVEPENGGAAAGQIIFSEDFEAGSPTADQWSQNSSAILISWGVGSANGGLPTESAYIQDITGSYTYAPQSPNATIRYDSPAFPATGASDMTLTFDYISNGETGGDSDFDYGTVWYSIDGGDWLRLSPLRLISQAEATSISMPLPSEANNANEIQIGFQWQNDEYLGNDKPLSFDNVVVTGTRGGKSNIATLNTAAVTTDAYVQAGETVHFYDANGNIMATLSNADQDLGCTSMEIISDGAAANIALTNQANSEAASKLFTITSELNSSTANYDITLFYTKAEIEAWIAGLAANSITTTVEDFKLFKSEDADVANAAALTVFDATTNIVYDANGIEGYELTGSFTGFSTFGGANVENPFDITEAITHVTCAGGSDGEIVLTPTNPLEVVTYDWEHGENTATISNLSAGIYSVTATNVALEQFIRSYEVLDGTPITAMFNLTEATCEAADGTADIMVSNAAAAYSIDWQDDQGMSIGSGSEANTVISDLAGGMYQAVVTNTDASACTATFSFEVVKNSGNLALDATITEVSCKGASTGAIDLTVNNATGTPSASWSNGAMTTDLMDVPAAAYAVEITDEAGCATTDTYVVNEPTTAVAAVPEITDESNCGNNDGTISIAPTGGTTTGNYSFAWADDTNANSTSPSNMRSGLAANTYTVSITDDNNCELVLTPTVSCAVILAVELLDFKVKLNTRNEAILAWHTEHESEFSHYEILRMNEAEQWVSLKQVNAKGQAHNDYQWTDNTVETSFKEGEVVYYQLKMVHSDGSIDFSKVESVQLPLSAGAWTLFPNPTSTMVDIVLGTTQDEPATGQVFSIEGKLLKTFMIVQPTVHERFTVDVSDLSVGVYLVQLRLVDGVRQMKLMVR